MSDKGDPEPSNDDELRLARLSASKALLDPTRRETRQDLLVSSLMSVLHAKGESTKRRLFDAVSGMWKTDAIAQPLLEEALERARTAGLVVELSDWEANVRYQLTESARVGCETDHAQLTDLITDFTLLIEDRLADYPDAIRLLPRLEKIRNLVIAAIGHATRGSYAVDAPGTSLWARPAEISVAAVEEFAKKQEPKSIREPIHQLALDALDPTDQFGTDIVHLVVVGTLLHGLAAQRGVDNPALAGTKLLLDTSAMVGLALPQADADHRLIRQILHLSKKCGATLVVAEHTLEEWERLWAAADDQYNRQTDRALQGMPLPLARLVDNAFLGAFLAYKDEGGNHSWIRWQEGKRDLRKTLAALDVEVVRYEALDDAEAELRESISQELLRLSQDERTRGSRSKTSAEADSKSATLIARWRRNSDESAAVFVAKDSLTERAFRIAAADERLVTSPDSLLMYVSHGVGEGPTSVIDAADLIADVAARDALFSMASGRSLDEVLDIAETLDEQPTDVLPRLVRELDDPSLFDSVDTLNNEAETDPSLRAAAVLKRLATRTANRAASRQALVEERVAVVRTAADSRLEDEFKRSADLERKLAEEQDARLALEGRHNQSELDRIQSQRLVKALAAGSIATIVLVFFVAWGFIAGVGIVVAIVLLFGGFALGWQWSEQPETATTKLAAATAGNVALNVLTGMLT